MFPLPNGVVVSLKQEIVKRSINPLSNSIEAESELNEFISAKLNQQK